MEKSQSHTRTHIRPHFCNGPNGLFIIFYYFICIVPTIQRMTIETTKREKIDLKEKLKSINYSNKSMNYLFVHIFIMRCIECSMAIWRTIKTFTISLSLSLSIFYEINKILESNALLLLTELCCIALLSVVIIIIGAPIILS